METGLRNVFACVILLRFLRTFLTQSIALRALRLGGNQALGPSVTYVRTIR